MAFNIVLVEPEIPQNTGNIARTCAVSGTNLHLIKPYGFAITDKNLKRAGLDYWHLLNITEYDSLDEFFEKNKGATFYYATSISFLCIILYFFRRIVRCKCTSHQDGCAFY